jgi:hypothetical protein
MRPQRIYFRVRLNEARLLPTNAQPSPLWILILFSCLGCVRTTEWKSTEGSGISPSLGFDGSGELLTSVSPPTIG